MFGHVDAYVRERVAMGDYSVASAQHVAGILAAFARWCDDRDLELSAVKRRDVETWLLDRRRSPSTMRSLLSTVRTFARWCVDHDLVDRDFTTGIRSPKVPEGLPRCLDPVAITAMLAAAPDVRATTVLVVMLQCGLRIGEVAALRIEDIDFDRRNVIVRGKGGRGRKTRTVPMPDEARAHLIRSIGDRRHGPVIASYNPPYGHMRSGSLGRVVRQLMTTAGIKSGPWDGVSAHACRHTTAQDLLDLGRDMRAIQILMGHKSIKTTEIYWRLDPPGLDEAAEGRRYA